MSAKYAFTPLPPSRRDATSRLGAVDSLAGTWRGIMTDAAGATDTFTLLRDGSVDAAVAGRFLFFATPTVAPTGVRLLEANNRAFVALIGPYYDPRENADVVTVLEGVRNGSAIQGTYYTRRHSWRDTVRSGQFIATCADAATRAA
jgi:hypothetical protein